MLIFNSVFILKPTTPGRRPLTRREVEKKGTISTEPLSYSCDQI